MKRIEVLTLPPTQVCRLPRKVTHYKKLTELHEGGTQMNVKACAPSDADNAWNSIDWEKCELYVKKLQARIVKAQENGRAGKVNSLQWLLTHSFSAKALAVKRVTSNTGKRTSGVDHEVWCTPQSKAKAILKLKRHGYSPQPLRRVHIKKSNGKLRPLGIPTMTDRTMQALYLMALDPVSETTADTVSYGFRKERCCWDAIEQCFTNLSQKSSAVWILEGDIKGCFDHISHAWLLKHIAMDKHILGKWLKSGFVFKNHLYPTDEGTPQGGIISPTLANLALDGLEEILAQKFKIRSPGGKYHNFKVNLTRYADDFIITAASKAVIEDEILPLVRDFLVKRGLVLSEEKTKITHIDDGFDFLGFNIRKYNGKLLIKPSKERVKSFLGKIRQIIRSNSECRQDYLIKLLNPVIQGWANYYRFSVASQIFDNTDHQIFIKLWKWSARRHPMKSRTWIVRKYYHHIGTRHWCFSYWRNTSDKQGPQYDVIRHLTDMKIERYIKIKKQANPYSVAWYAYFDKRYTYKMLQHLKGRNSLLFLWKSQDKRCPYCNQPIDKEQTWNVQRLEKDGKQTKLLVHDSCRRRNDQLKGIESVL